MERNAKFIDSTCKLSALYIVALCAVPAAHAAAMEDDVIQAQRQALAQNTVDQGFGPQSPRDIGQFYGTNMRVFGEAPNRSQMNLCNIHFHAGAEHKGGEFTTYAGNGDGNGFDTGFLFDGALSDAEATPLSQNVCKGRNHGGLNVGDTIEVHYVFSTAMVEPGASLSSCLADSTMNPGLRVEGQVMVLVNDPNATDFKQLAQVSEVNGYAQAPQIPSSTGNPVVYLGSTTGPSYNEKGSPLQVTWSVRPEVIKVNAASVGDWCASNPFKETQAHGVRNLVVNPKLLSPIN